jgi:transcriptional regulator with XRE-family HTH domain
MITIQQIKGARGILDWTQDELAAAAKISRPALNNLERGLTSPQAETLRRIRKALERAGIEFIAGGCRLKQETLDVQVFDGPEALFRLYDDVIDAYTGTGGVIYISGVDEKKFIKGGGVKSRLPPRDIWLVGRPLELGYAESPPSCAPQEGVTSRNGENPCWGLPGSLRTGVLLILSRLGGQRRIFSKSRIQSCGCLRPGGDILKRFQACIPDRGRMFPLGGRSFVRHLHNLPMTIGLLRSWRVAKVALTYPVGRGNVLLQCARL